MNNTLDFLLEPFKENITVDEIQIGTRVRVGRRQGSSNYLAEMNYYSDGDKGVIVGLVPTNLTHDSDIIYVKMDVDGKDVGFFRDRLMTVK